MHETGNTYFKSLLLFLILDIHVCFQCGFVRKLEASVGFPGDGASGICEPPDMGAESQMGS